MKTMIILPGAALVALALGYIWPYQPAGGHSSMASRWQWPEPVVQSKAELTPELLADFWPLSAPEANETKTAPARTGWQLVAVIRQGAQPQALVLDPDGKLLTLASGDMLDQQRTITRIEPTQVLWQSEQEQGELALFPRPQAETKHQQITNEN